MLPWSVPAAPALGKQGAALSTLPQDPAFTAAESPQGSR